MSRSRSSQSSSVSNTNINNVLDAGAIKSSFEFASGIADEAFDSVDSAMSVTERAVEHNADVTREALAANSKVIDEAFDGYDSLSSRAFESNSNVVAAALERLQTQNNRSLDALAGLQGAQASNNFKLLQGIQNTVRDDNSGGALVLLENQKYLYLVFALLAVGAFLIMRK